MSAPRENAAPTSECAADGHEPVSLIVLPSRLPTSDTDHACNDTPGDVVGVRPSSSGHRLHDTHTAIAAAHPLATDHRDTDDHCRRVGGEPSVDSHAPDETQCCIAVGSPPSSPTTAVTLSNETSSDWLNLRVWAEMYHDAQQHRIAATNRAERGGVHPDEYQPHIDALKVLEHQCGLVLVRTYRRVVSTEIREWQKASPGIGEHSLARLLGHLGHPVHATPHVWIGEGADRELKALEPFDRNVAKLWQYCGHGDPARRKRKGMTADEAFALGSPICKMLVHQLLAIACVKRPKGTVYRDVYDEARERYADRADDEGRPWTPLHQHNAALRFLGKRILKDLWLAGRTA